MDRWKASVAGLLLVAGLVEESRAQLPLPPTGGVSPLAAGTPVGASAVPATAAPRSIWTFLGFQPGHLGLMKQKICASQIGTLLTNGMAPISGLSGGLLSANFCPALPNANQLAAMEAAGMPTNQAMAAAAAVQADEATVKQRVAAVEYLATVDCHYWEKEVTDGLTAALRQDRNECVRLAAAKALLSGCCCNKKTIEALSNTVTGSTRDGAPSETSPRVRSIAFVALQRCLACYSEPTEPTMPPTAEPPIEQPRTIEAPSGVDTMPEPLLDENKTDAGTPPQILNMTPAPRLSSRMATPEDDGTVRLMAYYEKVDREKSSTQILREGKDALRKTLPWMKQEGGGVAVQGNRSVYHALSSALANTRPAEASIAPRPTASPNPRYNTSETLAPMSATYVSPAVPDRPTPASFTPPIAPVYPVPATYAPTTPAAEPLPVMPPLPSRVLDIPGPSQGPRSFPGATETSSSAPDLNARHGGLLGSLRRMGRPGAEVPPELYPTDAPINNILPPSYYEATRAPISTAANGVPLVSPSGVDPTDPSLEADSSRSSHGLFGALARKLRREE